MEKQLERRVERQAWFLRYPRGLPFALFGLGMLITLLFILNIEMADNEARRLKLDRDSTALVSELKRKASENIAYLNAASSMLSVTQDVRPEEFSQFVSDMSENHLSRGSLGMGWAAWIKARDASGFQAQLRREAGNADVTVRPLPGDGNTDMAVIALLEPQSPANHRALGYDMWSEATRRAAMTSAMRSGKAAVTGRVHLVQDEGKPSVAGFLIYVPVFERTVDGRVRRDALKGFAYTPLRANEVLEAAAGSFDRNGASVAVYDGPPQAANLLAEIGPRTFRRNHSERTLAFGDRTWTVVVTSSGVPGLTLASIAVLIAGTVVSLLLLALATIVVNRAADDRRVLESLSAQEAIRNSLTRELNHRVKNTLANVLSIVALTRRRSNSLDDFAEGLTGRLRALSATHDLLAQRNWKDAPVRDVVTAELAPYLDANDSHVEIEGPDTALGPNDAMSLGLALHELATNAAKYGALSVPQGRIAVTWKLLNPEVCEVHWRESGGPPVAAPTRRGFGLDLIEKIVSHELRAPVDLRFEADGVQCVLKVPVRSSSEFTLRRGQT